MKSVEWLLSKADKAYECGDPFKSQGDKLKQEAFDREIMIEKIRASKGSNELVGIIQDRIIKLMDRDDYDYDSVLFDFDNINAELISINDLIKSHKSRS